MRQIVVLMMLSGCLHTVAMAQARAGAAPIKPCSLLTLEMVSKVGAADKQAIDAGPKEVPLGTTGVACEWGSIMLQIDPVTPARLDELRKGKGWEAVPGVGDAAYFHNVRDITGELFVRVGARTFGILIDVPVGTTVGAFKPTFVTVANAIVAKLR